MSEPSPQVVTGLALNLTTEIVTRLAAMKAPIDSEFDICHLCKATGRQLHRPKVFYEDGKPIGTGMEDDPEGHERTCPWRMARELIIGP